MRIEAIKNLLIREGRTLVIPTYSEETLLDQLDDDETLLVGMVAHTPRLFDDIRGGIAEQSADDLAPVEHTLFSSLGAFGAVGAQRSSRALEALSVKKDLRQANAAFLKLEDELDNVFTAVKRLTGEVSPLAIFL